MMMSFGKVWGQTQPLLMRDGFQIHQIRIKANGRCSRHAHAHRHNLFYVSSGLMEIHVRKPHGLDEVTELRAGESTTVPPGEVHWFVAREDTVALEVYYLSPVDDGDIVREDQGEMIASPPRAYTGGKTAVDTLVSRRSVAFDFAGCTGVWSPSRARREQWAECPAEHLISVGSEWGFIVERFLYTFRELKNARIAYEEADKVGYGVIDKLEGECPESD